VASRQEPLVVPFDNFNNCRPQTLTWHTVCDTTSAVAKMSTTTTTTVTETPTLVTVTQQPAITAENVLRLFPEVNTSLIGGSHNSAANDSALDGYDASRYG
jgi:hypothetical protein